MGSPHLKRRVSAADERLIAAEAVAPPQEEDDGPPAKLHARSQTSRLALLPERIAMSEDIQSVGEDDVAEDTFADVEDHEAGHAVPEPLENLSAERRQDLYTELEGVLRAQRAAEAVSVRLRLIR